MHKLNVHNNGEKNGNEFKDNQKWILIFYYEDGGINRIKRYGKNAF